ncbi:hypothetical protein C0431_01200 [bacterium]|nr:hypothetical protein [bacterium]
MFPDIISKGSVRTINSNSLIGSFTAHWLGTPPALAWLMQVFERQWLWDDLQYGIARLHLLQNRIPKIYS